MNVTDILIDIVVVLLAAKIAAEIAERLGIPAVIGEILAGVVVGPSLLGLIDSSEVLEVLGELGVILLLLEVGLELSVKELRTVGRSSMLIAVIGVIVPVILGIGVGIGFGESSNTALFLGTALAATSVGITARVFSDLGALTRLEARAVLGAAVADDVLGLVLLTVVVRIVTLGSIDVVDVVQIVVIALAFLVIAVVLGSRFGPRIFAFIDRHAVSAGTFVALALAFTLAFASLADAAQLAPIIGAFAAGVALSGSAPAPRIRRELAPVGHLFIPVFFLQIGVHAELGALGDPKLLVLVAALVVVAAAGKLVAGLGLLGGIGDRLLVGLGMLPRGEVGLIFASIGLANGVLGQDLYAALVVVVLLTTLIAPPLLRGRIRVLDRRRPRRVAAPAPAEGWLRIGDDGVDLVAEPGDADALVVALDAARLVAAAPPSDGLLDWVGRARFDVVWDRRATGRLLGILRDGSVRSWRFLEAADVLERALPEIAEAVRRRRQDPFLLDPTNVLRFELVDELREIVTADPMAATVLERLRYPEQPVLAALVLSVSGGGDPVELGRRIADRLRLGVASEQALVALLEDRGLLRSAAERLDGLDEEPILSLASHLETPERARALYLVSRLGGGLDGTERTRLDAVLTAVLSCLAQPALTDRGTTTVVEARRREAMGRAGSGEAAERVRHAPRAAVLAQAPGDLARQADLLDPPLRAGSVRVRTSAAPEGEAGAGPTHRIDVATWRHQGVLSAVTGVLAGRRIDVISAATITWPDGVVVHSFTVHPPGDGSLGVDAPDLERAVVAALDAPVTVIPVDDAETEFDHESSPWHTLWTVRAADRPGLLHAITAAVDAVGAEVHTSSVETVGGVAIDRLGLTGPGGTKVDPDRCRALDAALRTGVAPLPARGRRFSRSRRGATL